MRGQLFPSPPFLNDDENDDDGDEESDDVGDDD